VVEVRGTLEELRELFAPGKGAVERGASKPTRGSGGSYSYLGQKASKPKRKASAYSKKYGRAFKKLQSKYKTKAGKWQKDGFKRCQKAAHALAKRMK